MYELELKSHAFMIGNHASRLYNLISASIFSTRCRVASTMSDIMLLPVTKRVASHDEAVKLSIQHPYQRCEIAGPYEDYTYPQTFHYVPSLQYLCIRALFLYPDQLNSFHEQKLGLKRSEQLYSFDLLKALCPSYGHKDELDLSTVDPRLWATICQLFTRASLADWPSCYKIPLSDQHMKLLQQVPSSPDFSLITVLELPGCDGLTDENMVVLKDIHSLAALDASNTRLSSHGVRELTMLLRWDNYGAKQGPWGLRLLRLRSCTSIDDSVYPHFKKFPLLTAVGESIEILCLYLYSRNM
jgi:hypothetical protein